MDRPRKQEQEPARDEVVEVAQNVLRTQLPIQMPGLGHVNMYALLDERGAAIVDPGLPGPLSWKAVLNRLRQAQLQPRDVHTVIVTHSHPDHFGNAQRLASEANAEIVTHAAFRNWWRPHSHGEEIDADEAELDPGDVPEQRSGRGSMTTPWGGQPYRPGMKRRLMFRLMRSRFSRRFGAPEPTTRVKNGDVLKLAGREWFALHTPGHTLDHLCLHDPEGSVLLSGDHVLPTITPHISGMNTGRDPLALFVESLDRVAALEDVALVLPAHGHPFDDVAGRVEVIKRHHAERLDKLRSVAADLGSATVEDFSQQLFRKERWGSMAESETYAHLEHLRLAGLAERHDRGDGVLLYEVDPL